MIIKQPISLDETVSQVLSSYPGTQKIFARHGLDLCCGGIHPIGMAARAHGIDENLLLAELNREAGRGA